MQKKMRFMNLFSNNKKQENELIEIKLEIENSRVEFYHFSYSSNDRKKIEEERNKIQEIIEKHTCHFLCPRESQSEETVIEFSKIFTNIISLAVRSKIDGIKKVNLVKKNKKKSKKEIEIIANKIKNLCPNKDAGFISEELLNSYWHQIIRLRSSTDVENFARVFAKKVDNYFERDSKKILRELIEKIKTDSRLHCIVFNNIMDVNSVTDEKLLDEKLLSVFGLELERWQPSKNVDMPSPWQISELEQGVGVYVLEEKEYAVSERLLVPEGNIFYRKYGFRRGVPSDQSRKDLREFLSARAAENNGIPQINERMSKIYEAIKQVSSGYRELLIGAFNQFSIPLEVEALSKEISDLLKRILENSSINDQPMVGLLIEVFFGLTLAEFQAVSRCCFKMNSDDLQQVKKVLTVVPNTLFQQEAFMQRQQTHTYSSGSRTSVAPQPSDQFFPAVGNSFYTVPDLLSLNVADFAPPSRDSATEFPFLKAILEGEKILPTTYPNVDVCDENKNNAAHYAAFFGRTEVIDQLKTLGCGMYRRQNSDGKPQLTPIHLAIFANQLNWVKKNYQAYSNTHSPSRALFPLPTLTGDSVTINLDVFQFAILMGRSDVVAFCLEKNKEAQSSEQVSLHWNVPGLGNVLHLAILSEQPLVLRRLLSACGDDEGKDHLEAATTGVGFGELKAIELAAALNRLGCLAELLSQYQLRSAYSKNRLSQTKRALKTGIDYAAFEAVRLLLANDKSLVNANFPWQYEEIETEINVLLYAVQKTGVGSDDSKKDRINRIVNILQSTSMDFSPFRIPKSVTSKIDNLVFCGGGVKGIALVGAYEALREQLKRRAEEQASDKELAQLLGFDNVKRIAGTSAGAILATLVALDFPSSKIKDILYELDFEQFLDYDLIKDSMKAQVKSVIGGVAQLVSNPREYLSSWLNQAGLCRGEKIRLWFIELLSEHLTAIENDTKTAPDVKKVLEALPHQHNSNGRTLDASLLTFGDIKKLVDVDSVRFKHLYIFTTQMVQDNKIGDLIQLDSEARPKKGKFSAENVLVVDAVRCSMSIPLVFQPGKLYERNSFNKSQLCWGGHVYVDGGVLKNYPLGAFDYLQYQPNLDDGDREYQVPNPFTCGLHLYTPVPKEEDLKTTGEKLADWVERNVELVRVAHELMNYYYAAEDILADFEGTHKERTFEISNCNISTTKFSLTRDDKEKLYEAGKAAISTVFSAEKASGNNPNSPKGADGRLKK